MNLESEANNFDHFNVSTIKSEKKQLPNGRKMRDGKTIFKKAKSSKTLQTPK